eukprot:13616_1
MSALPNPNKNPNKNQPQKRKLEVKNKNGNRTKRKKISRTDRIKLCIKHGWELPPCHFNESLSLAKTILEQLKCENEGLKAKLPMKGNSLVAIYPDKFTKLTSDVVSHLHKVSNNNHGEFDSFEGVIPLDESHPIHGYSSDIQSAIQSILKWSPDVAVAKINGKTRLDLVKSIDKIQIVHKIQINEVNKCELWTTLNDICAKNVKLTEFVSTPPPLMEHFAKLYSTEKKENDENIHKVNDELLQLHGEMEQLIADIESYTVAMQTVHQERLQLNTNIMIDGDMTEEEKTKIESMVRVLNNEKDIIKKEKEAQHEKEAQLRKLKELKRQSVSCKLKREACKTAITESKILGYDIHHSVHFIQSAAGMVAEGGNGEIYHGTMVMKKNEGRIHAFIDKQIVIKVPKYRTNNRKIVFDNLYHELAMHRLMEQNEIKGVSKLGFPSMIASEATPCLVLSTVSDSYTVHQLLNKGFVFEKRVAISVIQSIISTMKDLYDTLRLIHLDLSSGNVLINPTSNVSHVIDFGSARIVPAGKDVIDTRLVGTRKFVAPEVLLGDASVYSDIFSMGLLCLNIYHQGKGIYEYNEGMLQVSFMDYEDRLKRFEKGVSADYYTGIFMSMCRWNRQERLCYGEVLRRLSV